MKRKKPTRCARCTVGIKHYHSSGGLILVYCQLLKRNVSRPQSIDPDCPLPDAPEEKDRDMRDRIESSRAYRTKLFIRAIEEY